MGECIKKMEDDMFRGYFIPQFFMRGVFKFDDCVFNGRCFDGFFFQQCDDCGIGDDGDFRKFGGVFFYKWQMRRVWVLLGEEEVVEFVYACQIKRFFIEGEDAGVNEECFVLFLDKETGVEVFTDFHTVYYIRLWQRRSMAITL